MQEKESIMAVRCELKILSLGVTVRHHSASLVMPNSYPPDGIFNPHLTTIKDSYDLKAELRKTFSKFYRRHYDLVSKFNTGFKSLLKQGLSEPEFYDDLVYKNLLVEMIFLINLGK